MNLETAGSAVGVPYLLFRRDDRLGAYETALTALLGVGVRPSVAYDKIICQWSAGKIELFKLHWEIDSEHKDKMGSQECKIRVMADPLYIPVHAVG